MRPDISFYASSENPTVICAYLASVPVEELDELSARLRQTLGRIADDGIDMERMASVLERQKLQLYESMETDASDVICNAVVAGTCSACHSGHAIVTHTSISFYRRYLGS